ncbi:MAG: D-aminoacyl-tRNA deacylase [Gammaproteobacteria bacterium]|nr:D-aminoacyl-tRNA deacylase [Gammaproteobacteria bacterium]
MIVLLQRVSEASVTVGGRRIAEIGRGLLALVAVEPADGDEDVERMAERMLAYRIFADEGGRMNLNLGAVGGELLLVPQFTLAADTTRGNRPSFSAAASPAQGRQRFDELVASVRRRGQAAATGEFGADMQVALVNDGPVTFLLRVPAGA